MTTVDEHRALDHVRTGLSALFPTIAPTTVRAVVDEVYAGLDGPVRDYVPLLVERASRERLRELARRVDDGSQLVESGPDSTGETGAGERRHQSQVRGG